MIAPITPHLAEEIFWHASARSGATGVGGSEKEEMGRGPSVFTKPWTEMVCGYRSMHMGWKEVLIHSTNLTQ